MTDLTAAQGAKIALAHREAAQLKEVQRKTDCRIVLDMIKPVQDAINRINQIQGVNFSFLPNNLDNRIYTEFLVGNKEYAVIIDPREDGYAIYENQKNPKAGREYAKYEGGSKNLSSALGSIAMILGYHYPEHASAIDQVIQGPTVTNEMMSPVPR